MGVRWVAAALVVLGIISSMNLRVEGQAFRPDPAALERIVKFYHPFVNSGLDVGAECDKHDRNVLALAGRTSKFNYTDEMSNNYMQNPPFATREAGRFETEYPNMAKEQKWCKMKAGLDCADKVCKECEHAHRDHFCYHLSAIRDNAGPVSLKKDPENPHKDPKDPQKEPKDPGVVSRGGWSVRPVDGALVAALLAVFALSA